MYNHTKPLVDDYQKSGLVTKLLKIVGGLLTLVILILVGLSIFVRFYLTEERLMTLIIPQAETALGRTVTLGSIDVGLFSGITIKDMTVKEADNATDFLTLGQFVLQYDLLPLLQKELVISKVIIDQPTCRITRNKKGVFNFESIAASDKKTTPAKNPTSTTTENALPLALTVKQITINKAHVTVHDAKKELPEINITASADMGVAIGASLADLKVNGDFDFVSDIIYGTAKPQLSGKGSFDNNKAVCNLTVNIDQQQVNLIAKANDLNAKPLPPIQLDINSDKLNIDKLMALTDKLPQAPADKKTKQTAKTKKTAISAGLPPGLIVTGSVKVNEALYNKLAVRDFSLLYNLKDGIATMTDLSFKTAGGKLAGKARVDLTTTEPTYKGDLNIDALQIQELLASFASPQANILAGGMAADLNFSGTGFSVDQIKNFLHLDATYGMQKAKLSETPISNAVATILQLEQIKTMTLDKVDGNLQLKNGKLSLHSQLDGKDLKLQTNGNVNINSGALDLPLKLEFSGALAEQLQQKSSFMKYLSTKEGTTALNLKLTGSTSDPKATLDEKAAEKQIKKQLEKKVVDEIGKELFGSSPSEDKNKSAEPVKQLFKGLFGN